MPKPSHHLTPITDATGYSTDMPNDGEQHVESVCEALPIVILDVQRIDALRFAPPIPHGVTLCAAPEIQ